jgi:hypothetical protein
MRRDFAEVFLELNRRIKDLHNQVLKQDHVEAYLISCDVTELAQELEDIAVVEANKFRQ